MKSCDGHVFSGEVSEVSAPTCFLGVFGEICLFGSMARLPDGERHGPSFNEILSLASGQGLLGLACRKVEPCVILSYLSCCC